MLKRLLTFGFAAIVLALLGTLPVQAQTIRLVRPVPSVVATLAGYQVVTKTATVGHFALLTASCPQGKVVVGGTAFAASTGFLVSSIPNGGGTGWMGAASQATGTTVRLTVSAICVNRSAVPGWQIVQTSATVGNFSSVPYAQCPAGLDVVSGGTALQSGLPAQQISLTNSSLGGAQSWLGMGQDLNGKQFNVTVDAICVTTGAIKLQKVTKLFLKVTDKATLYATCPAGTQLLGVGMQNQNNVRGEVFYFNGSKIASPTRATITARYDPSKPSPGFLQVQYGSICG